MYDPDLARWTAPDPLADKYPGISPYVYCNDNPVNFVDQGGKAIDLIADVVSIGCGIYNLAQNIKAGNTKAAWGDVAGIGLDLVCAVIPGVTINAGTAKTLAKSSAEIADRVVDAKGAWNLNPFDRGKSIEKTLHGWGDNYPVIDFYNEGTKTATINDGADGSGGNGGGTDGVGVESITQTTTSTEDGGSNIVTATLTDGTTSTFTIRNGSKGSQGEQGIQGIQGEPGADGEDGYTPIRGTDYWTDEDKAEIVASVISALPNASGVMF